MNDLTTLSSYIAFRLVSSRSHSSRNSGLERIKCQETFFYKGGADVTGPFGLGTLCLKLLGDDGLGHLMSALWVTVWSTSRTSATSF